MPTSRLKADASVIGMKNTNTAVNPSNRYAVGPITYSTIGVWVQSGRH